VNIQECVAPKSNKTEKGLDFKKKVPMTIVPELDASFLLTV